MNRRDKFAWMLWLVGGAALAIVAAIVLHGCGAGTREATDEAAALHGASCEAKLTAAVFASETCTEAQLRVDVLLRTDPDCFATYGDGGRFEVCKLLLRQDGGTHGDR